MCLLRNLNSEKKMFSSANRTEASQMLDAILEKNRQPPSPPKHAARQPGYMSKYFSRPSVNF